MISVILIYPIKIWITLEVNLIRPLRRFGFSYLHINILLIIPVIFKYGYILRIIWSLLNVWGLDLDFILNMDSEPPGGPNGPLGPDCDPFSSYEKLREPPGNPNGPGRNDSDPIYHKNDDKEDSEKEPWMKENRRKLENIKNEIISRRNANGPEGDDIDPFSSYKNVNEKDKNE